MEELQNYITLDYSKNMKKLLYSEEKISIGLKVLFRSKLIILTKWIYFLIGLKNGCYWVIGRKSYRGYTC